MFAAACTSATSSAAPAQTDGLAIVGVTVLPMTGKERLTDQTVLVKGDRIVGVGDRSRVQIPAGYKRIEGEGRTVMPGLVDMHIHLSPAPGKPGDSTQRSLAMSLANGVTTARVMLGQPSHPEVRAAVERGEIVGPRIYIASKALNDENTPTAEAAVKSVEEAKAAKFDLIKAHAIANVPAWQAVQDRAKALGIPVAGHVTNEVGLKRALAARQEVEHLDAVPAELLPPEASRAFGQFLDGPILDELAKVPPERLPQLAKEVAATGVYFVPTLGAFERIAALGKPFEAMLSEPDAAYVAPWVIDQWRQQRMGLEGAGFTARDAERMSATRRSIVAAFKDAGVPMMAGSDTPHPFHVWGFGMIRDMEALGAAGLGPMGALRAATVVPRDYLRTLPNQGSALGWKADFGTVEAGARADLLLLDKDPSADLGALKSIRTVVAGGRVYDRAALDALLADARKAGTAQAPPSQAT